MEKRALSIGTALIGIGVILGAFGAHALKEALDASSLTSYETGVRYQIYHGLALLALSQTKILTKTISTLILVGITLFSGSIYLLVIDELMGVSLSYLGPITPIGGVILILSWVLLFINILREKSTK